MGFNTEHFVNNTCRACMSQFQNTTVNNEIMESIFNQRNLKNGPISIKELLQYVVDKLPKIDANDGLPKMICNLCLQRLIMCDEFQKMCINSDEILRSNLPNCIDEDVKCFSQEIFEAMNEIPGLMDPLQNKEIGAEIGEEEIKLEITIEENNEPIVTKNSTTIFNSRSEETDFKLKCIEEGRVPGFSTIKKIFNNSGDETTSATENDSNEYHNDETKTQAHDKYNSVMVEKRELSSDIKTENPKSTETLAKNIPEKVRCSICQNVFTSMKGLRNHTKRMHPEHYAPITKSLLKPIEVAKCFKCEECDRRFAQKRYLRKHKQIHEKKVLQKMQEGNVSNTIKRLKELRQNQNNVHLKEDQSIAKPYFCSIRTKDNKDHVSPRDHLMSYHSDEISFLCQECGKAFTTKGSLHQHQLRHRGEKRFECSVCIKKFPCSGDLSKHMRQVHAKLKPFVCDTCGAAFKQPHALKKHKMRHSGEKPYPCEHCGLRFVTDHHMRRHMRTHTGEKPYKCKYCERAFAQSNDLMKHLRLHVGENIYRCELCPKAFRLLSALRNHWPEHKNEDDITRELNRQVLLKEEEETLRIHLQQNQETVPKNFSNIDSNI